MTLNLSVVIPAKNEATSLPSLLRALTDLQSRVFEVIVVNDGSTDDTATVAESAGARVVNHAYSKGNGAAIKSGARAARGDLLLFMDADGQHRVEDIPLLLSHYESSDYDMVVGARDRKGQASLGRYLANSFYNKYASLLTGVKIHDLTSGFRLVTRKKFLEFEHILPNAFSYPTTITMCFVRAGYSVGYCSIDVEKREGESHIRPLRDGIRFLIIIFKVSTLYSPLKVFLPLAAIHFVLGLGRYAYTYATMGTFTNMSALLFAAAVQIFLIGLVSEQIAALLFSRKGQ